MNNIICRDNIRNKFWQQNRIEVPRYSLVDMETATVKTPKWIHFGAGNIFRIFIAGLADDLLNEGLENTGIIVAECFDREIPKKIYIPHDNLTLAVTMLSDGTFEEKIIGSVAKCFMCGKDEDMSWQAMKAYVIQPELQLISFTITEKGYKLTNSEGEYLPAVKQGMENGPGPSDSIIIYIASLLWERFRAGGRPIALVSMDNCSQNGKILQSSVIEIIDHWVANGIVSKEFKDYVADPSSVSFPWTMIDKITPRPSEEIKQKLETEGVCGLDIVKTKKGTYISAFVNAEKTQYLVAEDRFPNGRPCLERAGVIFTDRDTVEKVEAMKVTACLNPLHTALAIFGCLLNYDSIAGEMKNESLLSLIRRIGYDEALPVVDDPKIVDPKKFIDEVINERLPNPYIPDTPQRIATDTSQKLAIRYGKTIKKYIDRGMDIRKLTGTSLVIAGWLRYLTGVDDEGRLFTLSDDPALEWVCPIVRKAIETDDLNCLDEILNNKDIFLVDLVKENMASRIKVMFSEMLPENGVKNVLVKNMSEGYI